MAIGVSRSPYRSNIVLHVHISPLFFHLFGLKLGTPKKKESTRNLGFLINHLNLFSKHTMSFQAQAFFDAAEKLLPNQDFGDLKASFQFDISNGGDKQSWAIDIGKKKIVKGGVGSPTCRFTISDSDFVALVKKEVQPAELFMSGRLQLDGDMSVALKFQSVLEGIQVDPTFFLFIKGKKLTFWKFFDTCLKIEQIQIVKKPKLLK
ncbi:hypothetical protein RFI_01115 [Reticulomyxa filosa]|uniref:SCP2 domain-containing protein n=1 Tax=Reticulomyxa filosa TaxID=46433 RepID=X6PBR9_RETFI|nr:hypothetical protein RFI_01115 [Reticulomyxa filosa]|eukprot:ETO35945.1 hypothetical protein RFI_01115 [Reticulomyxa filosa]